MGYSIAKKAMAYGADVILISGPTNLTPPKGAQVISVESAEEMYNAVMTYREEADIIIKTAAVSDYKPTIVYDHKVKKQSNSETIEFTHPRYFIRTWKKKRTADSHWLCSGNTKYG